MRSERKLHQCTFIRARISSFWRMRISSYFYLSERRWRCHDDEGERRRWKQDTKAKSWKWGRSRKIVQLSANQNWTRLKASSTIRSQTRKKFFFHFSFFSQRAVNILSLQSKFPGKAMKIHPSNHFHWRTWISFHKRFSFSFFFFI